MKVRDILAFFGIKNNDNKEIYNVSDKSYFPKKNWIYFNLSSYDNAKKYIEEAKNNNAYLIFSKHNIDKAIYIEDLDSKITSFLHYFYKFKRKFKLIGITGTNGKSSISNFLKQSLRLLNYNVKNIVTNKENYAFVSKNTTPNQFELFSIFRNANKQKLDYLIMEVSSIGIAEKRVSSIDFDYIFLTNLKEDHISYHGSIEAYHQTKINFINENKKAIKFIPEIYKNQIKAKYYVDYQIEEVNNIYQLSINKINIETKLIFKNNLINLAYVFYFLKYLKVSNINLILKKIRPFKGRNDLVSTNPFVVIDYAHTSSSFYDIVSECYKLFSRKMIVVFGSGGNRDRNKREEYAKILNSFNSYSIITNDNPRDENPKKIALEIGFHLKNYEIELDRKKAIKRAFDLSDDNSMILILGKGNENYISYGNYMEFHNDYDEVEKCLKNLI